MAAEQYYCLRYLEEIIKRNNGKVIKECNEEINEEFFI